MTAITEAISEIVTRTRSRADSCGDAVGDDAALALAVFDALADAGFVDVAVPESFGGGGGTVDDLAEVVRGLAAQGVVLPIAALNIGAMICAEGGTDPSIMPAMFAAGHTVRCSEDDGCDAVSLAWVDRAKTLTVP